MIAAVTGLAAAGTVMLLGGAVYAALTVAARQLAELDRLDDERTERLAACDHAHTLYLGDVLVDANAGNRWLDSWAPVERCVACDTELVGAPRFTR